MTTWPAPVAQRPSCRRKAVSLAAPARVESKPLPKYGPSPTGLPSRPMIRAWSEMSPTAAPTCGTLRTSSMTLASIVGFWTVKSLAESTLNAVRAETTASVPS